MAAFRFFPLFRSRGAAVRSAYDETTPSALGRPPLTARWSARSAGGPACRWTA